MLADLQKDLIYWQEEHTHCSSMANQAFKLGDPEGARTWLNEIEECEKQIALIQKEIKKCQPPPQ